MSKKNWGVRGAKPPGRLERFIKQVNKLLDHVKTVPHAFPCIPMLSQASKMASNCLNIVKKIKNHHFWKYLVWDGSQDLRNAFFKVPEADDTPKYGVRTGFGSGLSQFLSSTKASVYRVW